MKWYEKYPERLKEEMDYIETHKDSEYAFGLHRDFFESGIFYYSFNIKFNKKILKAICLYPYQYPYQRIHVIIYENNKPYIKGFHNTMGELCLFGHNPDGWRYNYGIKEIIDRVKEWFIIGQYNTEDTIPEGYDDMNNLYIFSKEINQVKEGIGTFTYKKVKERCDLRIVNKVEMKDGTALDLDNKLLNIFDYDEVGKGIVIITSKERWLKYNYENNTISNISQYLNAYGGSKYILQKVEKEKISFPFPLIIIYQNYNYEGNAFEIAKNKSMQISKYVLYKDSDSIFNRTGDMDYQSLDNKTVMLVGIGSIGSQLAIQLAKSGIKNFILIDYQKLEIENIIKHELTLKDIHRYKTKALREKLLQINPYISCITCETHIENQEFISKLGKEYIRKSSVIISTIDDDNASYILDGLCLEMNKIVIYVNAFYKAKAGVVAISNKKMACLDCLTEQIENMKSKLPDFNLGMDDNYRCANNSYIASQNYNLNIVNLGVRIILNYLNNKMPKDNEGHMYNCYFIGNEEMKSLDGKEFFTNEITVRRYSIPGYRGCCVCGNE